MFVILSVGDKTSLVAKRRILKMKGAPPADKPAINKEGAPPACLPATPPALPVFRVVPLIF